MKASESLPEPLEFLKTLHKSGVRYLLIGRQAIIAYGGPMQSMDYDLYVDGSEENISKLLEIAKSFELYPSIPKSEMKKTFKFKLENDYIFDIFKARSMASKETGKITFEEIYSRKFTIKDKSGLEINLPSIDDLILLKKMRSSPKDLLDIKYLEQLK